MFKRVKKSKLGMCPICDDILFEGDHIKCIIPYKKDSLKDRINAGIDEKNYDNIYKYINPPKNKKGEYDLYWRQYWTEEFISYTLFPSLDIINYLVDLINNDNVLEIGARDGLYASILKNFDVNICVTGDKTDFSYTDIEVKNPCDAIKKYGNKSTSSEFFCNTLFIIWNAKCPTYEDLEHFNGNKVIIIGHAAYTHVLGGVFNCLCYEKAQYDYNIQNKWELKQSIAIPSWFGLQEKIYFIERI